MLPTRQLGVGEQIPDTLSQELSTYSCFVDGSWMEGGIAGIGVYLLHNGKVVLWISKAIQAVNPAQAEAKALLEGYQTLIERANGEDVVLSDSKELVTALASKQPLINDWRSFKQIWEAWNLQKQYQHTISAKHCGREHPNLGIAHRLANQDRIYG